MSSISRTGYKTLVLSFTECKCGVFFTGVKPPPQKKAKLSETDARYEKEKRKREPQKTWKDLGWMDVFLSSALKCMGFSIGQPRIHQGNQIHGFRCPAFEIGTTWIFF